MEVRKMERTRAKKAAIIEVTGEKKTRKHKPTKALLADGTCAGEVYML